jgi:platelet-activating factor acetylhydrolase
MLHSSHGLAVGDFKYVGIRYFQGTDQHPPLRIFYPAEVLKDASKEIQSKPAGWFAENSLGYILSGYLHAFGAPHDTLVFRWILFPLLYGLSIFFPVRWISIPDVFWEAPVAKSSDKKHPVVVFSHGLSGTGQENSVLLSCWAKRGFVVVSVHHRDGSSCRVPLPDGSSKYYQRGPPFSNYDRNFRLSQIQLRAKEMKQAVSFLRNDFQDCPQEILENVNLTAVVAAGFSYGAATAALAAVEEDTSPQLFKGLILLDGWFYIDVSGSDGIEF